MTLDDTRHSTTPGRLARTAMALCALLIAGCGGPGDVGEDIRGGGAPVAKLDATQQAGAYDAALRAAFDVDSALVLLIDRSILPRSGGFEARDTLDAAVVRALRDAGAIRGECAPIRKDDKHGPTCVSTAPGYVVRVTDLYQLRGDTVRMFLNANRFQTAAGIGPAQKFSFESGYELLRRNGTWRIVREGRRIQK